MQEPNYSEWWQRQLWTLVEAACLLSGIEPLPPEQFNKDNRTAGVPRKIYADLKDAIDLEQLNFVSHAIHTFGGGASNPTSASRGPSRGEGMRFPTSC